jgi:hypothetical protein
MKQTHPKTLYVVIQTVKNIEEFTKGGILYFEGTESQNMNIEEC